MDLSSFGKQLTRKSGILALMDDLGQAMAEPGGKCMLGGGNPAHIPELDDTFRRRMVEILNDSSAYERMIGNYDTPRGRDAFLGALADLFRSEYGWDISRRNITVVNGSQTGFFILLNLLSGRFDGEATGAGAPTGPGERTGMGAPTGKGERVGKVFFPLMPEYIGYANQALHDEAFEAHLPWIEEIDEHTHKYRVNLSDLELSRETAAVCVSRPTNPTGNVLTDAEVHALDRVAKSHGVPLILDNAYGIPFPGMIFRDAEPIWNENIILAMSLSKIGLPSTRTGILVAREEIIDAISSANAIVSLANGSVGQAIMQPLIENGDIIRLSRDVVRPFYERKVRRAREWIDEAFTRHGVDYSVHVSEGALFLWVWFRSLRSSTSELYERLKERGVIVVPGKYFAFGLDEAWEHADQCIRINYAMDDEQVRQGIAIIAEEAARLQD